MIIKGEPHKHDFQKVYKKTVPVRSVIREDGETILDRISGVDTIYYKKCSGEHCKATLTFHLKRKKK